MIVTRLIKRAAKALIPERLHLVRRVRKVLKEEFELHAVMALSNGGVYIDVGANVGAWSAAAARAFRQVQAFEPNRDLVDRIRRVLPKNVTVYNVALSDGEGTATLFVPIIDRQVLVGRASLDPGANGNVNSIPQDVALRTLDSYEFSGLDVIKIDVEGHEMEVLRGAERTLERERPALVVEIEERHHQGRSESVIEWVCARGYDAYYYTGTKLARFQSGDIARLQRNLPTVGMEPSGAYVNNFLFLPKGKSNLVDNLEQAIKTFRSSRS